MIDTVDQSRSFAGAPSGVGKAATTATARVAVVVPAFRASQSVVDVVRCIGVEVDHILVVDDACPDGSGRRVDEEVDDPRVEVIFNPVNLGVGGAMVVGYRRAMELDATVCVKLDADGQMDPALIPRFIAPLLAGEADYVKGNRFFHMRDVVEMPGLRLLGNAALSFLSKLSTGYWHVFDPTNGFTAIHSVCLEHVELGKIDQRFFFESDLLFRLHLIDAVVADLPMRATYADETSNLSPMREIPRFAVSHTRNFLKRIFYEYYLRDFNLASLQLLGGSLLLLFGAVYGATVWITNLARAAESPPGTVGVVTMAMILGFVFIQGFVAFDYARIPQRPLQRRLQ
ncbi:glycosyltransferase family 2 protein [Luteimonas kalidii]|uniref:Glycosyltransferase family 2 protein n=1 Tax=Luteimonas kalidii TaxID=3042025 RepID=A0ABT6JVL2_9GAMM|nr:glycosyltransferase family 2 protein [Luteimonas kalidii]MDH5833991.1 glycosyltransferase family 2 protein [Luteimonas kalidii]